MAVTNPLAQAEAALQEQLKAAQKQVDDIQAMINGIRNLQKKEPVIISKKPIEVKPVFRTKRPIKPEREKKSPKRKTKPREYPKEYTDKLPLYQKVYIALSNIKNGTIFDVMKEMKRLDPGNKKYKKPETLRKMASNGLYMLLKEHKKIKANLEGKNYRYFS